MNHSGLTTSDPLQVEYVAEDDAECDPDAEQRERRNGEALELDPHEMPDRLPAPARPFPCLEVAVAADVEEQWHHLQQPGREEESPCETDRIGGVRTVFAPDDDREDPVPSNDDEQAQGAQEIDVVVAPVALDVGHLGTVSHW